MDESDASSWKSAAALILNWILLTAFALHSTLWYVLGIVFAKVQIGRAHV